MVSFIELQAIIRAYGGSPDDNSEHTIVWLDRHSEKAIEPGIFSGLRYDLIKIVTVPNKWIWLTDQSLEVGNFLTNEIVNLRYRVRVQIPIGSEKKAAERLAGRGNKKPGEWLRDTIQEWLISWFAEHPNDMSRIEHRIADAQDGVQEALAIAMAGELGVDVVIKFEFDDVIKSRVIRLLPDLFGSMTIPLKDVRELPLPARFNIDLARDGRAAREVSVLPPEGTVGWVSTLRPVVEQAFATNVTLHDYYFNHRKVENCLRNAVDSAVGASGFTCNALHISGLATPPFDIVGNACTVVAPAGGYPTTDPTFSANFDTVILWHVSDAGSLKDFLFPNYRLVEELHSAVHLAAKTVMRGTASDLYLGHFDVPLSTMPSTNKGYPVLASQKETVSVADQLRVQMKYELERKIGRAFVVEQIGFLQKDEEFIIITSLIRELPDSTVRLELDVINARGIAQRINAVFHVSGISQVNPMKARQRIDPLNLRTDMQNWSEECLKNMPLADIARIDVHEPGKAFTSGTRQRLQAYVAQKAVEFYGIVVVLKSVNRIVTTVDEMFEPAFEVIEDWIRISREAGGGLQAKMHVSKLLGVKQALISLHLNAINDQREGHLDHGAIGILTGQIGRILDETDSRLLVERGRTSDVDDL